MTALLAACLIWTNIEDWSSGNPALHPGAFSSRLVVCLRGVLRVGAIDESVADI